MGKRLALIAVGAAALALPPASASAEQGPTGIAVGWRCTANTTLPNQTLLAAGQVGTNILPIVPTGADSVITGWEVGMGAGLGPIAQRLQVFEPLGSGQYKKVAESRTETVSGGPSNFFKARITVSGGESVGLFGPGGTLACDEPGATSLRSEGGAAVGETRSFVLESAVGTPLSVSVEPDHDRDGYGDGTQDRCPESASRGSDCPIGVRISGVAVNQRAILLEVTPKAWARINVRGEFRWRAPSTSPGKPGLLVGTDRNTGSKRVGANDPRGFRLPLPEQVLRRLDRMRAGESMAARIEVQVTDRQGWQSERSRLVVMWGRNSARSAP
ncbi:MAG TPA: hypothetical protein VFI03_09875 [Solirubrobacterales bacterium]|nr:hypothetical protein [Solirubrobacterales bacterium]